MAWIKSHSELITHPKVKKAARILGISVITMIGHLHALWWWTLEHAPDGFISRYDPEEIADAIMWEGDIQAFFDALVTCGAKNSAGLLDKDEDGELYIHDWEEHCGNEYEKRKKEAERLRQYREKQKKENIKQVQSKSVLSTYDVRNEYVHGEIEKEIEIDKDKNTPPTPPGGAADAETLTLSAEKLPENGDGARSEQSQSGKEAEYTAEFNAFWDVYPRKQRKQDAFTSWKCKGKRSPDEVKNIMLAAEAYGKAMRYLEKSPDVILHPTTFLNKNRWQEWLPPDGAEYLEAREIAKRLNTNTDRKAPYPRGRPQHEPEPVPDTYVEAKAMAERRKAERERRGATLDAEFRNLGGEIT